MKTIEELYKSILADNDLKAQYAEAIKANKLDEFLKAQGCNATVEDVKAFLESKKEIAPDELNSVAGGCNDYEAAMSILTLGLGCIAAAIASEMSDDTLGMGEGSILC